MCASLNQLLNRSFTGLNLIYSSMAQEKNERLLAVVSLSFGEGGTNRSQGNSTEANDLSHHIL